MKSNSASESIRHLHEDGFIYEDWHISEDWHIHESWRECVQRTKWALALVMLVFGLLITTQVRVQNQVVTDPGKLRANELVGQLKAVQDKLDATEMERDRLASDVEKLRKANEAAQPAPPPDITPIEILAGTRAIQGPGLIINLTESPEFGVKAHVQDEDLWLVVNELLAAGAEGITVNGQRLTALSGIRDVGQRIMVYQSMTHSPIEFGAVGDPTVMEAALRLRGGVVDVLAKWGIKVAIQRSDAIHLPAFKVPPIFRFAKPS